MLKRFFNQIEHYWSSGQQHDQGAQSAGIVASKSVRPNTAMLHSQDAMSPCSPSHSFHEGLAQLALGQQRSDPNTLPHCWTVSSHGTMDRGLSDIVELRSLSAAAAGARPKQVLNTRWGHRFLLTSLDLPTYCDFCGQVLFGLAHRCEYCCTSCHTLCSERLCLSCRRPSPFNRDSNPNGNQNNEDLSPFDVFETAKSDLWMAVKSQSNASTAAVSAASSVSTNIADDQEAVAYTPRLRSQQQQQHSCQKHRRKRRTRTSSADTLLSGQNSLLLTAGGDCEGSADKVDDHPLNSDSDSSSDDVTPNGSDCSEDFYSTASTDMSSIMSSLPPPPSPPASLYRRSQQLHEASECQFHSLLSTEAAYSLSSLDTASLAQAGIRVLESTSAATGEAAGDGLSVASVSEASTFYCDWTPERLRRHLAELTARLPGQEFRIVRSNSIVCEDSLAEVESADSNSRPQQFRGSLRVHVNLLRPVRAEQPAAAFFLPRGNATLLHDLESRDTADRVVSLLLAKHRIRDPPHKFALFEHEIRGDKTVIVRKVMQHERPLEILLSWTTLPPDEMRRAFERRKFILQENESSTVDWHAFTIPELNNFLLILSLEEEQRAKEIRLTFDISRAQLRRRLFELEKQRQQQQQQQQQQQSSSSTASVEPDI